MMTDWPCTGWKCCNKAVGATCYQTCEFTPGPDAGGYDRTVWFGNDATINQNNGMANFDTVDAWGLPYSSAIPNVQDIDPSPNMDDVTHAANTNEELRWLSYITIPPAECIGLDPATPLLIDINRLGFGFLAMYESPDLDETNAVFISSNLGTTPAQVGVTAHAWGDSYFAATYGVDGGPGGSAINVVGQHRYSIDGGTTWQLIPPTWIHPNKASALVTVNTLHTWSCVAGICTNEIVQIATEASVQTMPGAVVVDC